MAFIDEIQFHAKAGRGGDGVVRWRREKFIPKGGPSGGDGGRGGNVYIEAVRDNQLLSKYRHVDTFEAEDGKPGEAGSRHGRDGEDRFIKLPIGSIVRNTQSKEEFRLEKEDDRFEILKGGHGGLGNEQFKSSTNVTPKEFTEGKWGEEGDFTVELELFADIGLIGLPNAGKSSLLNALTRARAKVGDYAFTTLDPNLGDLYGFTIADIPGLIEGASEGKGLGTKFLRHIKRTGALVHLVSFENELASTGGMMKVYKEIRKELASYSKELAEKPELILLTKTDVLADDVREEIVSKKKKEFEKLGREVYAITLFDDADVKIANDAIIGFIKGQVSQ